MSISSEITRISNAKTAIAESIANKGVTVPSGTKIDGMAALIDSIPAGGGAPSLQSKSVTYTSNGTATITPDDGYDGLSSVDVTVNVASGGGDTSETWVIKSDATGELVTTQIAFTSNGQKYTSIGTIYSGVYVVLRYDNNEVAGYEAGFGGVVYEFNDESYRKLTFDTTPTGALLTWLQSNAVKQASDTAVQPSKALTVTSNGTTTITPDAPYDAIKQVDLTVNVASGGGGGAGFKVTFPATANGWNYVIAGVSHILLADGTTKSVQDYSTIGGKTIENVAGILVKGIDEAYVLRMTLSEGRIAQCTMNVSECHVTTAPNTTPTPAYSGIFTVWWPISDTVISAIEMYNTD